MSDATFFLWLVWFVVVIFVWLLSILVRSLTRPKLEPQLLPADMLGFSVIVAIQFVIITSMLTVLTLFLANSFDLDFVYEFANTGTKSLRSAFGVY